MTPRITPMLYEVKPRDWTVLIVAAACAFAVAGIAALIRSLSAGQLHPASLLREE